MASSAVPVLVEVIDDDAHVEQLLPIFDAMVTGRAVVNPAHAASYGIGCFRLANSNSLRSLPVRLWMDYPKLPCWRERRNRERLILQYTLLRQELAHPRWI